MLCDLIAAAGVCRRCRKGKLICREVQRHGLATELQISCESCRFFESSVLSQSKSVSKTTVYQANRRAVLGMRMIGRGYNALCTLSTIMDMPVPMAKSAFQRHSMKLNEAAVEVGMRSMKTAAKAVISVRAKEPSPRDVAVSTDGTWMRRGYSSMYGVQTVIAWDTYQVIDVEISSKCCASCTSYKSRKASGTITEDQLAEWQASHDGSCTINTTVSSPAMEATSVVSLWKRSEERNNLRYTEYIGDGDSKGFRNVRDEKLYGETEVVKEECIGHVQKRLGKGMRDLKQKLGSEKLEDGKPIGGKGRLTDKKIDNLQNYYGMAIRNHVGNVSESRRAIWASISHESSTNERPRHEYCPPGKKSWCGYQKALAHDKTYIHKPALPKSVSDKVKPVGAFDYTSESIHESIHAYSSRSTTGVRSVEPMRNRFAGFTWGDANTQCQIWFT